MFSKITLFSRKLIPSPFLKNKNNTVYQFSNTKQESREIFCFVNFISFYWSNYSALSKEQLLKLDAIAKR